MQSFLGSKLMARSIGKNSACKQESRNFGCSEDLILSEYAPQLMPDVTSLGTGRRSTPRKTRTCWRISYRGRVPLKLLGMLRKISQKETGLATTTERLYMPKVSLHDMTSGSCGNCQLVQHSNVGLGNMEQSNLFSCWCPCHANRRTRRIHIDT